MTKFTTIPDIPIVQTGVEYPVSTGVISFTEDDLADAVRAATEDPSVKSPRVKLGHVEGTWAVGGEPNFGNFINLRLSWDGQQILADLETLEWLADLLPVVYPSRSIEADLNVVHNETGKSYRMVISAVALLGVELPGVSTLDDLRDILEDPEVSILDEKVQVMASASGRIKAQIDAEDIRRSFYESVATADENRYWWWLRSIRLEPNEVIATDDDSGQLYRVPFTISDREVTWGEPVPVYVEYVDEPVDDEDAEPLAASKSILASWRTAASSRNKQGGVTVDPKELRAQLGLAEDATDDEVKARLDELKAAADSVSEDESEDEVETTSEDDDGDDEEVSSESEIQEPVAAGSTVTIDRDTLERLQKDAQMGVAARKQQIKAEHERIVDDAIKAGKFAPARRKYWLTLMAKDEQGTKDSINELAPGLLPVTEEGATVSAERGDAGGDVSYMSDFLSSAERERIARARAKAQGGD